MNVQELLKEIKASAESGLMGETWGLADRLANMREALEQIMKLCNASPDNNPIMTILKEVAQEHTQDNDGMNLECVFCNGNCDYEIQIDDIAHEATCPTLIARTILREAGQPLQAYCIEYEYLDGFYGRRRETKQYKAGYNEDEIKKWFPEGKKHNHYNVKITYMRDM